MDYSSVVEALDLSELVVIDPMRKNELGPFGYSGLNTYFDLPEAVRPAFVLGLKNMMRNFYGVQMRLAGEGRNWDYGCIRNMTYEEMANDFGQLFDGGLRQKLAEGKEVMEGRVWELRRIFYQMINGLTVQQVEEVVKIIEEMGWISDWSEVSSTIMARTGARG